MNRKRINRNMLYIFTHACVLVATAGVFGPNTTLITGKSASMKKKLQHLVNEIFIHLQQTDIIAK